MIASPQGHKTFSGQSHAYHMALAPYRPVYAPRPSTYPRRPLRISVVTETFPPEINGVARTMGRFVDMLLERGHAIDLIRPRLPDETRSATPERTGLREYLVRGMPIPRYGDLQVGLAWPNTLANTWQSSPPDLVQIVTEGPLGWSAMIAARRLGIPLASNFHTNFHAYSGHYGLGLMKRFISIGLRTLHNRCAATMVPTEEMRAQLEREGFLRLSVVGRGIDTRLFSPARRSTELRAQWRCKNDEPVALYVGRLAPEKNLKLFVRAALALRAADPRTRIVLVGDGPDAAALQQAHPDFIFCGMRKGEDLAAHYASADYFLFPSTTETFGNVTTEALASGLAVVAFDYAAAHQHIRHGESGLLMPFDDASAFIAATAQLAAQNRDDQVRNLAAMRRRARAVAEGLSWDRILDDLEEVLLRVADGVDASAPPAPATMAARAAASQPTL